MLVSDIDEEIASSVTDMSNLYRWHDSDPSVKEDWIMQFGYGQAQQTALAFYVLSGLTVDLKEQISTPILANHLSMAGAGIRVYQQALADANVLSD